MYNYQTDLRERLVTMGAHLATLRRDNTDLREKYDDLAAESLRMGAQSAELAVVVSTLSGKALGATDSERKSGGV